MLLHEQIEKLRAKAEYLDDIARVMLSKDVSELPKTLQALTVSGELSITEFRDNERSGKMFLVPSVGTICFACNRCRERMLNILPDETEDERCVCKYCYVQDSMNLENELFRLYRNHNMLQDILTEDCIEKTAIHLVKLATTGKTIKSGKYAGYYPPSFSVRVESKGDTDSAIHALNYFRLAEAIKRIDARVNVSAWTKNPDHYENARVLYESVFGNYCTIAYFRSVLTLIYSAFKLNQNGINEIERVKSQYPIITGGFMVYDENGKNTDTSEEHDAVNAAYVSENYASSDNELFACKCSFGSCGVKCKKCYAASARDTVRDFIACEQVR